MKRLLLPAILIFGTIIACSNSGDLATQSEPASAVRPTVPPAAIATNPPEPTDTVSPAAAAASCIPSGSVQRTGKVIRVVDGDTIKVAMDGLIYTVRYIGMDTPETVKPNTPVQYFGKEASARNQDLVMGKTVTLVRDVSEMDAYGRQLAYVLVGDLFVNYELVAQGFATSLTVPPDVACSETFRTAEQDAREHGRGLWGPTPTGKPRSTREPTSTPRPAATRQPAPTPNPFVAPPPVDAGNCDSHYPDVCIAPPPPDLDCGNISFRRFRVVGGDPHRFDGDHDGIGCESG